MVTCFDANHLGHLNLPMSKSLTPLNESKLLFNHDSQAESYDEEVMDESNPIRRGYAETLDRLAMYARTSKKPYSSCIVADLGSGTGNLSLKLLGATRLLCVDISQLMLKKARAKIRTTPDGTATEFLQGDILPFLTKARGLDVIVSSYAFHHLTHKERLLAFAEMAKALAPGGAVAIGDLMFADTIDQHKLLSGFRAEGRGEMVEDIQREFFWDVELTTAALKRDGWLVSFERISTLSWVLIARRRD